MELGPHPGLRPLGKTTVRRRPRRTDRRSGQLLPCAAGRGHEHDRGQHLTVAMPTPTTALRPRRRLRRHPLEQLPQLIRHQPLDNPHDASPLRIARADGLSPGRLEVTADKSEGALPAGDFVAAAVPVGQDLVEHHSPEVRSPVLVDGFADEAGHPCVADQQVLVVLPAVVLEARPPSPHRRHLGRPGASGPSHIACCGSRSGPCQWRKPGRLAADRRGWRAGGSGSESGPRP